VLGIVIFTKTAYVGMLDINKKGGYFMSYIDDFIKNQLKSGFSKENIKDTLIKAGYDLELVENKLKEHEKKVIASSIINDKSIDSKLDSKIIQYIEKSLEKGYSISKIKQALQKVGYEVKKVDKHISHVVKNHDLYKWMKIYALIGGVVFLLVIIGLFIFFIKPVDEQNNELIIEETLDNINMETEKPETGCGNGICESDELGSCMADCGKSFLGLEKHSDCGNGICEYFELGACQEDCG